MTADFLLQQQTGRLACFSFPSFYALSAPTTTAKMVHLSSIPNPEEVEHDIVHEVKKLHLSLAEHDDCFTTSVYGTKFAAADLPKHEMPEGEMPREVAYRMIKVSAILYLLLGPRRIIFG